MEGSGGLLWSRQGSRLVPIDLTPYKGKRRKESIKGVVMAKCGNLFTIPNTNITFLKRYPLMQDSFP